MFNFLRSLLIPPIFPDDEDKTRAARHTHFITLFIIVAIIVYEAWIKVYTRKPINNFDLAMFGLLVIFISIWVVLKSGRVNLSSILLVTIFWVVSNTIPALGYGIHDSTFIANFVVVIIATLLLGWQASLAFGLLSVLSAFGLVYLEEIGVLSSPPPYPSQVFAQDLVLMILLSVISLFFLSSSLLASLQKTRTVLNELSAKNKEMNRIQSDLQTQSVQLDELNRINLGRATQLKVIIQIVHDIASVRHLDELLNLTAILLRERFDYYHVGIFLIDENGEYANLRAASGTASDALLDQLYKFKVGEVALVGSVASSGEAQTIQNTEAQAIPFQNPLLPLTRSELGIPMRSRGRIIGVLDIHSIEPAAFNQDSIEVLQLFTEQFVTTFENVELVQRLEKTLAELNTIYQAQTKQAWENTLRQRGEISLEYDGLQVKPARDQLPIDIIQQLKTGKPVVLSKNGDARVGQKNHHQDMLVIPLMVLNQMIGAIGLQPENPKHAWTEEEIALAEVITNRAALALENARLLEAAQRRAAKERTIGEITAKIGTLVDVDNIVQTTIQELSQMIPGTEVAIQFHQK